jgi:type IV pilus assembly protein PilO
MREIDFDTVSTWSFPLRIVVIIGICGIWGIAGYLILLQGQQQQLRDAQQTQASLRATFTQQQADVARLPAYQAQQMALQAQLAQIISAKSSKAAMADVLVDISQSGLAAGVIFELFQPQTVITHDLYVELPVKLRITGRYHALGAFVSSLANRSQMMTLHDMQLRPQHTSGKISEKPRLMLETTVKAYRDRQLDSP